jgi:dienelactone hydrolase
VADRLADHGFCLAVPDLFNGKPWPMTEYPPPDMESFMAWIASVGDVKTNADKVIAAKQFLAESRGATACGTVGFCWGSCVSLYLAGALWGRAQDCVLGSTPSAAMQWWQTA